VELPRVDAGHEAAQGVLGDGEVLARDPRGAFLLAPDDRLGQAAANGLERRPLASYAAVQLQEERPMSEGYADFRGHRTWYRVTGTLDANTAPAAEAPLVVVHGGPGCTHDYLDSLAELNAATGRAVIHYDQLGNGRSTHLPDRGADLLAQHD
jgi:hypothetical protein